MSILSELQEEAEAKRKQVVDLERTLADLQKELRDLQRIAGELPWYRKYAPHLAIAGAITAAITYLSLRK